MQSDRISWKRDTILLHPFYLRPLWINQRWRDANLIWSGCLGKKYCCCRCCWSPWSSASRRPRQSWPWAASPSPWTPNPRRTREATGWWRARSCCWWSCCCGRASAGPPASCSCSEKHWSCLGLHTRKKSIVTLVAWHFVLCIFNLSHIRPILILNNGS